MDQAQVLLDGLWEPFSFLSLFGYICLGILLGSFIGLLLALFLQRRGWLARRKRWHHWLLKLHFLLLPLGGAVLGSQGGMLYGGQQQVHRHLESYAPLVQVVAGGVWLEFERFFAEQDQHALGQQLQRMSVQEVLNQLAAQYVQEQLLAHAPQLDGASLSERVGLKLYEQLQQQLLSVAVRDMAVEQAGKYSGVKPQVILDVLDARVEQLFHADFLLGLLKQQLSQVLKPFYLTLLVLLALMLGLVAAEVLLSRYLGQWRVEGAAPALASAEPQVQ
ncbi:hypothetical protein HNE05_14745 [Aquipseudomonas campi]|uniref:Uncharacterized protein n=1 Tax=Aquipseudomonas campi TaxID=2731681 RepID=A0A6M8FKQ4_9GAMM|nr:hypothetical protein [Pseudomonas campi]QKE64550.1 hypothetical protein HNE05_14745 [Pseudomonas campi]